MQPTTAPNQISDFRLSPEAIPNPDHLLEISRPFPATARVDRDDDDSKSPSLARVKACSPPRLLCNGKVRRLAAGTISHSTHGPPEHMEKPSNAHEIAAAMEMAKHRMAELGSSDSGLSSPETPPETTVTDAYAYAFDIDGVLIRGGKPIPEAVKPMEVLNGLNEFGIKV